MFKRLLSRSPRGVCGITLALACAGAVTPAAGEGLSVGTPWGLCPAEPALPERPFADAKQRGSGNIAVNADEAEVVEEGVSTFRGKVQVSQFDQAMQASRVDYDKKQDLITASGDVRYWDNTLFWAGEKASLERPKDLAQGEHGRYRLLNKRGRGAARLIKVETKNDITRLEDVDYTTCPGETPAWKLAAKDIKLDHNADRGRAWHIFLHVRDVPVLYLPYLNFPISDKRKTGLLPPTFGNSSNSGADFRIPYYWNIAPNQDATFTPRILSDRGVLLEAQHRYLTHSGDGQFDLELLPGDNQRKDDDRAAVGVKLNQRFASDRGTATVDYSWVSDKDYVEDFGTSLGLTSERFLLQRGTASYAGGTWSLFGQALNYQSIDDSLLSANDEPYKILPQVVFSYSPWGGNRRLNAYLVADTTYFEREGSVTGARVDLAPVLSFPMRSAGTFLVPSLRVRHTQYFLDDPRKQFNDRIERTLPLFSIDSGLTLERDFPFGRTGWLHTLEPRLFYLYVPKTGQEDIPIFDTGEYDISYFNLFRDNRFIGLDRIGDANQFSLGLTSRLVGRDSGWEYFRASIGQQYFLRDREVQLPRQAIEGNTASPYIVEFAARLPSGWSAIYDLQRDPDGKTEKSAARIRYQSEDGKIVNAAYRLRRDQLNRAEFDLEQTDVSARWPITRNWSILGRWNFSLASSETLEAVGGVEYNNCCWGVRAVFRRFLRNTEREFDNAFFVQIELKGLAGLGRGATTFLRRSIPGYENEF